MPRHRPPRAVWRTLRRLVWRRAGGRCHIDHIHSGKLAGNALANLRVLCFRCHARRLDARHRGLTGRALRRGLIPPDYRRFLWAEEHWPSPETIAALKTWLVAHQ